MSINLKPDFERVLEPFGSEAAAFFLAASLYHARIVSFSAAANLADMGFERFLGALREHFEQGFLVSNETVLEDIQTAKVLFANEGRLS